MKKLVVIILLLVNHIGFGQNQKVIDSLNTILKSASSKSDSIKLLDSISWDLKRNYPEVAKEYALTGIKISNGIYEEKKILFRNTLGVIYRQTNEIDKALNQYRECIFLSKKHKKQNGLAIAYLNMGVLYKNRSQKDTALYNYMLAEKAISFEEDSLKARKILIALKNNTANIHSENNEKLKALEVYFELEKNCIRLNFENELASIYNNIANIYEDDLNYSKSLFYHKKSLYYEEKTNNKNGISTSYAAISSIFSHLKEKDSSLFYITKSIDLANEINYVKQKSNSYTLLGEYYLNQKKHEQALPYFQKALKIARIIENNDYITDNLVYVAQCNLNTKHLKSVILYLDEAFFVSNYKRFDFQDKAYDTYLKYYYSTGNMKEVNRYSKLLDSLEIKHRQLFRSKKIQELQVKYETQQKENEILQLSSERIVQDTALTKSRYATFGTLGVFMIFIGLGYFFWSKRKQTHRLALLENTVKISEAEKSRIGKELHDGIAGSLMKLVHDSETAQIKLSHKLLETYNEVRSLSHQLDNTSVHGELFLDRVLDVFPENSESQKFNFSITPRHLEIPEPNGTHVYRIIQELITNSIKYASATETRITLIQEDKTLTFSYTDNGVGVAEFKKGNGHKNIEDRIALMNGSLTIQTENGFNLNFEIPYTT